MCIHLFNASVAMSNAVTECAHTDQIQIQANRSTVEGCETCLDIGATWVHLRMCLTCGYVGCCDSSEHKHARAHADASGHPIIQSVEPGERWGWCYEDEVYIKGLPIP
ncbi:MAG: UBP-type zinc finger domain-containing protein [Rhodothermales bacterium]